MKTNPSDRFSDIFGKIAGERKVTSGNAPGAPKWAGLGLIFRVDMNQNRLRIPNL